MPIVLPSLSLTRPDVKFCQVSSPHPGVLLVLIDRPRQLNSLTTEANFELDRLFQWFDHEPSLLVAVISGVGKSFCVGADIKEWIHNTKNDIPFRCPETGFGGLSFRRGKKPIIAAVNGPAFGGGFEMVLNCDMVIAAQSATFGLPEVKRGVAATGGGLARLMKLAGRQRATELALTGRTATADELASYGIINHVVKDGTNVVDKAIEYAKMISENSPDAVIVTREGLGLEWESMGVTGATRFFLEGWSNRVYAGENVKEGLESFLEKRKPRWKQSKL